MSNRTDLAEATKTLLTLLDTIAEVRRAADRLEALAPAQKGCPCWAHAEQKKTLHELGKECGDFATERLNAE